MQGIFLVQLVAEQILAKPSESKYDLNYCFAILCIIHGKYAEFFSLQMKELAKDIP
jgi:hypothetical protein